MSGLTKSLSPIRQPLSVNLQCLSMVLLFAGGMVWVYKKRWEPVRNIIGVSVLVLFLSYLVSEYIIPFNLVWVQWILCLWYDYLFDLFVA